MTYNEVMNYISTLAPINGELKTKKEIRSWFDRMREGRKMPVKIICTVTMPDGEWLCLVDGDVNNGYSWYIPEDRAAEDRLWRWVRDGGLSDRR